MDKFNGIEISEHKLALHYGLFMLLLAVLLVTSAIWLYTMRNSTSAKTKQRLINLKARAETDESAKKQLEKLERKIKRRRERKLGTIVTNVILLCVIIALMVGIVFVGIIPPLQDHIEKDYAVYTGKIEVRYYTRARRSRIILVDENIVLKGKADFQPNDSYGTVVYAQRSRIVLGGQAVE